MFKSHKQPIDRGMNKLIKCFHQILLISGGNWGENWCWRRRIFCCYYAGWLNCLNLVLNYQNRKLHKPKNSWQELKIGENTLLLFRFFLSQIWIVLIRHKDIKRLEEGITEIHSMFMDLAILVEQQGEMVTRIEDHINSEQINLVLPFSLPLCLLGTTANNSVIIWITWQSFQLPLLMWKRDEIILEKQKTCKSLQGKRR